LRRAKRRRSSSITTDQTRPQDNQRRAATRCARAGNLCVWIGNPEYGCELGPIDFVAFAKVCADGCRCRRADELRPTIEAALKSPSAALEVVVDANEKPEKPDELKT
jgi:hypothetical protein